VVEIFEEKYLLVVIVNVIISMVSVLKTVTLLVLNICIFCGGYVTKYSFLATSKKNHLTSRLLLKIPHELLECTSKSDVEKIFGHVLCFQNPTGEFFSAVLKDFIHEAALFLSVLISYLLIARIGRTSDRTSSDKPMLSNNIETNKDFAKKLICPQCGGEGFIYSGDVCNLCDGYGFINGPSGRPFDNRLP
jgi:hypothetical protein